MKTRKSAPKSVRPGVSPQVAARLAVLAARAEEDDLTCAHAHALLDQFAECKARGGDPAALMPLVQRHLKDCPGCCEEYEALLRMIAGVGDDHV